VLSILTQWLFLFQLQSKSLQVTSEEGN